MLRASLIAAVSIVTALPAVASISGTVMTRDGVALAGARVTTYGLESIDARKARLSSDKPEPVALSSVSTNATGSFVLESPKEGVVTLRVEARGYAPQGEEVERDDDSLVYALTPAVSRQGTITAEGKPVAGARVIVTGGGAELIVITDGAGHYSVPDPGKWANRLTVRHPDFAEIDETIGLRRQLVLDHSLDAGVALAGRVTQADGKTAVSKATVLVDGSLVTLSGEDGSFTIAHAPRNWEQLEVRQGDLVASKARAGKSDMTLKLTSGASVSGSLRDGRRLPIAGAVVAIANLPSGPGRGMAIRSATFTSTVTDAKGLFAIGGLPPGAYQIVVTHPAYASPSSGLVLTAGQRAQKALAATRRARITGNVLDDMKKAIAAASVSAQTVSREPRGMFPPGMRGLMRGGRSTFSGPDGRFSVRTDADGDIELEAAKKGFPSGKSAAIHIAAGEKKAGITITMPRGLLLTGRVVDGAGKPISGAAILPAAAEAGSGFPGGRRMVTMIAGLRAGDDDQVQTASDGTFATRVKEGSYDVSVKREGYSTKTVRGVAVNATSKPLEVSLDPGVEISGKVVRSGVGVDGVNVGAISPEGNANAVTGPDGHFTLSDLTAGQYMVLVNKQEDFVQQMRNATAPAHDLTIELPAGGRVTGHVIDKSTHQPVTSFQVGVTLSRTGGAMQIQMPPMLKSFTSDDGSFVLDNVPVGTQQIVATAPGYMQARVTNVTVEEGKTAADIEISIETGVRLTGHVTGPDGSPLSGVSVREDNGGGGAMMRMVMNFGGEGSTVTDANGDYTADQLESGDKSFQFALEGYLPATKTVTLSARETRLDVQLAIGSRVSGTVVTEAGAPVPDADIRASSAVSGGGGFRATRTDANGGFTFEGLAPGHYTFNASKAGYADGSLRDFDISSGAPLRIALKTGGVIYGHVTGLSASDLGKVTVQARASGGTSEGVVDSSGSYRIEGAPTGSVRVAGELMRSFSDGRESDFKMVDLVPGASVQVDLVFNSSTVVTGRVTRDSAALASSAVAFIPTSGGSRVQVTTDESGNYSASGLSDGSYSVMVIDTQRMSPYSTSYTVHGSSTFDIDIKTAVLRGRVTETGSGDPVANARVQMRSKDATAIMSMRGASTDDSGAFTIDSVSSGQYILTAEKDGYGNDVRDVSVSEGGAQPVELTIAKNDGVVLKVVDARDAQALNANVVVYDGSGRTVYESGFRNSSEKLTLAPGQYRAVVGAMGYASRSVTFTSPSVQTVAMTPGGTIVLRSKQSDPARRVRLLDGSGQPYTRPMALDATYSAAGSSSTINNVAPGGYTVEVTSGGVVVNRVTVNVLEGQTATVDI